MDIKAQLQEAAKTLKQIEMQLAQSKDEVPDRLSEKLSEVQRALFDVLTEELPPELRYPLQNLVSGQKRTSLDSALVKARILESHRIARQVDVQFSAETKEKQRPQLLEIANRLDELAKEDEQKS